MQRLKFRVFCSFQEKALQLGFESVFLLRFPQFVGELVPDSRVLLGEIVHIVLRVQGSML